MQGRKTTVVVGLSCAAVLAVLLKAAWPLLREQFYIARLRSDVAERRIQAIEKLGDLGSPGTIKRLLIRYPEVEVRDVSTKEGEEEQDEEEAALKRALTRLCKRWRLASSRYLLDGLKSEDSRMRSITCEVLERTREGTPPIIEELTSLVLQDCTLAQYDAAYALAAIAGEDALPVLMRILNNDEHNEEFDRKAAAQAIGMIGPAAKAAIPSLRKALEALPYPQGVALALACIGSSAIPCLLEELDHPKPMVRRYAAISLKNMAVLKRMGPATGEAVGKLLEVQKRETDSLVKLAVYEALREIRASNGNMPP